MLVRRPSGYSYRKKIPVFLSPIIGKNEIWVSLNTNNKVVANNRVYAIHSLVNELFIKVKIVSDELVKKANKNQKNNSKKIPKILSLIAENEQITKELSIDIGEELAQDCNDSIRNILNDVYKPIFNTIIEYYEIKIKEIKAKYKRANVNYLCCLMEQHRDFDDFFNIANEGVQRLTTTLSKYKIALDNQKDTSAMETQLGEMMHMMSNMQLRMKSTEPTVSPLFSVASEVFITASSKEWKDSDFRGYRNSIKRFIECCGDKEIRLYNGQDVGKFKELMEQLPANYGKSTKDTRSIEELIEDANKRDLERVSGKSVKNHFSKLSTIWSYYAQRDLVEKNIFVGWKINTKAKIKRIAWSDDYLKNLIHASFNIKSSVSKETYGYIVGVASYTGMRLEEICRIRVQDIQYFHGIPCINICEHKPLNQKPETAWNPKTEAGERIVPISQKLIDSGFLDYINKAKEQKECYIFSDLKFSGKDNKRSGLFQRNFSTHKAKLGVPESTVFHSFRHNISTQLRNIHEHGDGGLREVWIDSFLGHEGNSKSVGNTVYLDAVNIQNLQRVANSVKYPDFWDIRELMK